MVAPMPDASPPAPPPEPSTDPAPAVLDAPASWRDDLVIAAIFLTRLPLTRFARPHDPRGLQRALRAFPLVGALIGLAAALVYWLAGVLGLAPLPAALVAV